MRQSADKFTLDLIDKPRRGRPPKPNALTPAERAQRYRDKVLAAEIDRLGFNKRHPTRGRRDFGIPRPTRAQLPLVAALFVREDSIYLDILCVDAWTATRDAKKWPGGCPVVAHPPCRGWGNLSHFAKPAPGEKDLGLWAVEQVRRYGGVLEHPRGSKLWAAAGLPRPGQALDAHGGWTLPIAQFWFGHKAEKQTWLYIVGCDKPPALPLRGGRASHVIATGTRNDDGSRTSKGDPKWRPEVSQPEREHTPPELAEWLVSLARLCKPPNGP